MAKKRRFSTFSLSFLDIMSCGFGAVALVFLIIKHDVDTNVESTHKNLLAEVNLLEEEVLIGEEGLVKTRNTLSTIDQQLVDAKGLAKRIIEEINTTEGRIKSLNQRDTDDDVSQLQKQLRELEQEKQALLEQNEAIGNRALQFIGEGDRQYLTGLKLGGNRVLILVDASASMLDDTLINVIRRRNMSDSAKQQSKKWQRAVKTAEWVSSQLPPDSFFQMYTFNTKIDALVPSSRDQWLSVSNEQDLQTAVKSLYNTIPEGGTSLLNAFASIRQFERRPDNIILITDGLPTQGAQKPKKNTVDAVTRYKLFEEAVNTLPDRVPINTILFAMEGDPLAAMSYWRLAIDSKGSFLSPSKDWPL